LRSEQTVAKDSIRFHRRLSRFFSLIAVHIGPYFARLPRRVVAERQYRSIDLNSLRGRIIVQGKSINFLTSHVKKLRGGSQPILAQASDGNFYVVKFINNLQGANLCFNESAGSELFRALGLPVPIWKPLRVTDAFIDHNRACWIQTETGSLRPEPGLCFGSQYLGREGVRLLEVLPGSSFSRVLNIRNFVLAWLIDIFAKHADNRQAIFIEDASRGLKAFFVDHGHLFGGPKGDLQPKSVTSRYLDPRIYQGVCSQYLMSCQETARRLDADRLWQRVQALPSEWKTASALDEFAQCISRFSIPSLIQSTLDTMCDTQKKADVKDLGKRQDERRPSVTILHPRLQASEHGCRIACNCASRSAVA